MAKKTKAYKKQLNNMYKNSGNDFAWSYTLNKDNDLLPPFEKEEWGFMVQLVIRDKTIDPNHEEFRVVEKENVFYFMPDVIANGLDNINAIDITFLMHKAIKIMRDNPDLDIEIQIVSRNAYHYSDEDGKFYPDHFLEDSKE